MKRANLLVTLGVGVLIATQAAAGPPVPSAVQIAPLPAPRVKIAPSSAMIPAGVRPLANVPLVPKFTPIARPTIVRTARYNNFCFINKPCQLRVSGFGPAQAGRFIAMEDPKLSPKPVNMIVKEWREGEVTFIPLVVIRNKEEWENGNTRRVTITLRDAGGKLLSNAYSLEVGMVVPMRPIDADQDGRNSEDTGGDDCDDRDRRRFPGNAEVADEDDHDEDCNYKTFGFVDRDGDGFPDARSCNFDPNEHVWYCGNDCDDTNPAIYPGEMVCDPRSPTTIYVCGASRTLPNRWTRDPREPGGFWEPYDCGAIRPGSKCLAQPNGRGVCL
ncbi:MAG TPA: MopE-related protein [Labilithrix sp.]|nr:MopE-related protein [Labilithrix sp.]